VRQVALDTFVETDDTTPQKTGTVALRSNCGSGCFMRKWLNRHRFLVAFGALSSLMGISVGLAKVTTSLYAISLGANDAQLGLIAGSQSVGVLLMSLPLGMLVERYGPQRLFLIGTACAGALYAVLPLVRSPLYLLLCTASIGFFMPFRFVSLNTIFLRQLLSLGQNKAGWYRGTHVAGMFLLGPLLAASAIEHFDYKGTYWLICAVFTLTLVLSPIVLGRAEARSAVQPHAERQLSALVARLKVGFEDAELRLACSIETGAQTINGYYTFFIVAIAVTKLGFSKNEAAGLVATQGLSYVFALFALGGTATRLGLAGSSLISGILLLSALVLLGLVHELFWLQCGGLLLGFGLGMLQIVNLMRFARIGARLGHGQTAGMNALAGPLGGLLGSTVGGGLGRHLGLQTMFLCFVPLALWLGMTAASIQPWFSGERVSKRR
jgi:MFS family permease